MKTIIRSFVLGLFVTVIALALPLSAKAVECIPSGESFNTDCGSEDTRFCKGGPISNDGDQFYFYNLTVHEQTCATKSTESTCLAEVYSGKKLCVWKAATPASTSTPLGAPPTSTSESEIGKPVQANSITSDYLKGRYPKPDGYDGPLPDCAFSGTCRSTSDLVILLINIAKFLFSIIGVVAFAAFVYGGFMMIFSFGNSDKVGQGKDAMVAAVVGLIIAFGAYMIINFVLTALGVDENFRGVISSNQ